MNERFVSLSLRERVGVRVGPLFLLIIFLNTGVLLASFKDLIPFPIPLGRICEMGSGILMSLHILGRIRGQNFR
jgi:hypothetical protein